MRHPFKLSKANIIYSIVVSLIVTPLLLIINGISVHSIGIILGSLIGIFLIPLFFAILFWIILGRKLKGGTTTFNIVLTLSLLGQISSFSEEISQKRKPLYDSNEAVSEYKENAKLNPGLANVNYKEL